MSDVVTRKIGDVDVTLTYDSYHKDGRRYAIERLDKDEAAYLDAVAISETPINVLVSELENTHMISQEINQKTCVNCGRQTLVERRSRMRVFGGLFWTDSEPAPFKKCLNCKHEQEANYFQSPSQSMFIKQAEVRIERAKRLRAKYERSGKGNG